MEAIFTVSGPREVCVVDRVDIRLHTGISKVSGFKSLIPWIWLSCSLANIYVFNDIRTQIESDFAFNSVNNIDMSFV